ncbi:MAG: DUF4019 domain-containing protein [Betaproteobacteria bacterium]
MNFSRTFMLVLALLGACFTGNAQAAMAPDEQQAVNAAERWLVPVDAGRSADAYAMAAAAFKSAVGREQWRDGVRDMRKPYGRVVERKAAKLASKSENPKGDPGEQVVILFDTKFAGNKLATEEITLVRETDGLWRVAGYYIR